MSGKYRILSTFAATALVFMTSANAAETIRNHAWDYQVHGSGGAMSRASLMWQAKQPRLASNASASGLSTGGIMPGIGSIANMNVVTVVVGDNSEATVAVEAEQTNSGNIDATAVSASGKTVTIGDIR
jgi:hypothetical protein